MKKSLNFLTILGFFIFYSSPGKADIRLDLHLVKKLPVTEGLAVSKELYKSVVLNQDESHWLDLKDRHKIEIASFSPHGNESSSFESIIILTRFYRLNAKEELELLDEKYLRFRPGVTTLFGDLKIAEHPLELTVTPVFL